ncbi:MAG: hypothetical protein BGO28_03885 [Alphaproteobacteria bacterium 43-37]|nr:MAG: hypothetical protein BGO28_03885 [Alphaproteobacteria bacterium 43-37]
MLLLLSLRFFGSLGVMAYIIIAITATNIQVLKLVSYQWMPDPVAYGTITFATTFLATDILTEFYGKKTAQTAIFIGFCSMLIMMLMMVLTLGVRATNASFPVDAQPHMLALFKPAPQLFVASVIAYLSSHLIETTIFAKISALTNRKLLWLRTNASTIFATAVDNFVFSILAWIILAETPLPWSVVFQTYIVGTMIMRAIIAVLTSPTLYIAKRFLPKHSIGFSNAPQ